MDFLSFLLSVPSSLSAFLSVRSASLYPAPLEIRPDTGRVAGAGKDLPRFSRSYFFARGTKKERAATAKFCTNHFVPLVHRENDGKRAVLSLVFLRRFFFCRMNTRQPRERGEPAFRPSFGVTFASSPAFPLFFRFRKHLLEDARLLSRLGEFPRQRGPRRRVPPCSSPLAESNV